MKKIGTILAILTVVAIVAPLGFGGESIPTAASAPEGYRIGPGDVLQVIVWREPEASIGEVVVRADGMISLPLLKELTAAGATPRELERTIAGRLEKFVKEPDVTV